MPIVPALKRCLRPSAVGVLIAGAALLLPLATPPPISADPLARATPTKTPTRATPTKTPTRATATPTRPPATPTATPIPAATPAPTETPEPPPPDGSLRFDEGDCGPPSTTIPGPPPQSIVVGQPMSDSWLMCYIRRDIEGQTYSFDRWGETRKTSFRGYPVECWNQEADPGAGGRQTEGIVAQMYGWNLDHTQYVRFTYRIQLDGDYINNCQQDILPTP